jgi:predicted MFS family arabinose efflux permease
MRKTNWAARFIFLAFGMAISSWAPMVPFAKERLEVDDAQLGAILLLFGLGALGTMPMTGWLIQRFGSRTLVLFSGCIAILLLPMLTIASTPLILSLILFLYGACTGALNVSINAQAVLIEQNSGRTLMSGLHCFFSLGGLLGALIISILLDQQLSLFISSLLVAIVICLLLVSQWRYLIPEAIKEKQTEASDIFFAIPGIKVITLGMFCFLSFMAEGSMLDWSAEFLRTSRGYETSNAGLGYACFSIAMAFGRLMGDRLISRTSIFTVFQAGCFLAACGFMIEVFFSFSYSELWGFFLIGLGASNIVPILFSSSGRLPSISASYTLTIVTTLGYVGALIGPAFIGFLAQATTLSFAFASIALLLILVGSTGRLAIPAPSYT